MFRLLRPLSTLPIRLFRSRCDLLLENLALRQQLAVLKRRRPQPRFTASDRLFWIMLRWLWGGWKQALILVQPETIVRWHKAGFKAYWTWLSQHRAPAGRKFISVELREPSDAVAAGSNGLHRLENERRLGASPVDFLPYHLWSFHRLHVLLPRAAVFAKTHPVSAYLGPAGFEAEADWHTSPSSLVSFHRTLCRTSHSSGIRATFTTALSRLDEV